jgi:transmembrane sensor
VEDGLRRWLADDPGHAAAFALMTDTWEKSTQLRRRPTDFTYLWRGRSIQVNFPRALLATLLIALITVIGTGYFLRSDAIETGVAERRTFTLDDGSRLYLNASTRVRVSYDARERRIDLEQGEALFEVAKRPDWPFVVHAGGREIAALGTSFMVRRDEQSVVVTLMTGKVAITPKEQVEPFVLSPGQRLSIANAGPLKLDRPKLERVTAWKNGRVVLDDTPLSEAVEEVNHYSHQRILLDDPSLAGIRVSGIFIAGDSTNFAQAVAKAYGLYVSTPSSDTIVLSRSAQ